MTDEKILALVAQDSSSDFSEDVGEHGGYFSYSIQGDVLTVKVEAMTGGWTMNPDTEVTTRSWKLTPLPDARS